MTTDYRALCAELTNELSGYKMANPMHDRFLLNRARAALAEPEPPKSCAVDPIPLSERKPGPEDMDGGLVWAGSNAPGLPYWEWCIDDIYTPCSAGYTHWLPASIKYLPARVRGPSDAEIAEPEPPTDGEVAELVDSLLSEAGCEDVHGNCATITATELRRAALLLQRLALQQVPEGPSDDELLELMPQQFRDDLATVSRLAAHGTSLDVTPGIFRVSLNTGALDYARAVLARWGRQPAQDASAPCPPGG